MKNAHKNEPVRMETWLSIGLLVVLSITGAGVYLRQFQFNPAVLAIDPEARGGEFSRKPEQETLIDAKGSDITPFSPPERFDSDNLYEKINGRADLYLSTGFLSLRTQRYTTQKLGGEWVEVYVYDMGRPENAFSVFSMQRRTDGSVESKKANAYATDNALFLVQGNFYLELIGTNASDEGKRVRELLSQKFMGAYGNTMDESLPGASLFPEEGFDTGSLQLISADAFGHENLNQVYTGDYSINGERLTVFVSVRENAEMATLLANDYQKALLSFGANVVDPNTGFDGATVIQIFDTYEIIFSRGEFFAGVHEAKDLEAAIRVATDLLVHLEGLRER